MDLAFAQDGMVFKASPYGRLGVKALRPALGTQMSLRNQGEG